jgi:hypothetical protein
VEKESFWSYPNNKQQNWITYRESIEFKQGLENLEKCKAILPISKALIIAVSLNLKKAAEISFDKKISNYDEVEIFLSDLGVYFFRDEERENLNFNINGDQYEGFFIIGSTPDNINDAIEKTRPNYADKNYHQKFGESMDFPKSSIEAFVESQKNGKKELVLNVSDDKLTDEEKAFLFFKLSSKNWEEEIQWLEKIISAVKEYSPKIYNEVIEQYRKKRFKNQF